MCCHFVCLYHFIGARARERERNFRTFSLWGKPIVNPAYLFVCLEPNLNSHSHIDSQREEVSKIDWSKYLFSRLRQTSDQKSEFAFERVQLIDRISNNFYWFTLLYSPKMQLFVINKSINRYGWWSRSHCLINRNHFVESDFFYQIVLVSRNQ